MLFAGRLVERVGAGPVMAATAMCMAAGLALAGTLGSLALLVAGVVLFVVGSGAFDVAINGAALGDEAWSRPARLTLLHAAFSGGGVIGALGAGAFLGIGASFQVVYFVLAATLLSVGALAATVRTARTAAAGGRVPLASCAAGRLPARRAGAAAFVGALGPAAFHAAMLVGRLIGVGVAGSLGASATLLVAGSMTLGGMVVGLAVSLPGLAIAGMAVAALGAAFVVPVVVSLAGRVRGRTPVERRHTC